MHWLDAWIMASPLPKNSITGCTWSKQARTGCESCRFGIRLGGLRSLSSVGVCGVRKWKGTHSRRTRVTEPRARFGWESDFPGFADAASIDVRKRLKSFVSDASL